MNKDHSIKPLDEEKKQAGEVTRRDFLVGAGTVVIGGAVGAGLLSSCKGETQTVTTTKTVEKTVTTTVGGGSGVTVTETKTVGGEGAVTVTKTVTQPGSGGALPPALEPEETVACSLSYGMNMLADRKNNRIVRMRRMRYDDDSSLTPWEIEARGVKWKRPNKASCGAMYLGHRTRVDSPNRVRFPLKRVDWEPGGDPEKINAQNRGKSNYVRISWDEATDIIAGEMKRIADKYGPEALSNVDSSGHPEGHYLTGSAGIQNTFLQWFAQKEYGGKNTTSSSGAATTSSGGQLGGQWVMGRTYQEEDVLKDIADNCEMILGWGCEVESKTWLAGTGHLFGIWYKWLKEIGVKMVYIMPDLTLGTGRLADKWIPVVPTTDAAMMLAIAYIWIQEGTYDQDYLDTHTVGFDADHMPVDYGADPKDNFKDYVLGTYDGVPKTPEWASPICGVTTYTIKALAREWADKATSIGYGARGGGAVGRTQYGHNPQRIQLYLQCMQGLFGPGKHQFIGISLFGQPTQSALGRLSAAITGGSYLSAAQRKDTIPPTPDGYQRQMFPRDYFHNAIYEKPAYWYTTGDQFTRVQYPLDGYPAVHFMWGCGGSFTGSRQWGFGYQKGMMSPEIECSVQQAIYMEDGTAFADIILPISCIEELPEMKTHGDMVAAISIRTEPVVSPLGESVSDLECICRVAEKLGGDYLTHILGGKTYDEVIQENLRAGFEGSGIADKVTWEEFTQKTYHLSDVDPAWYDRVPASQAFYLDPVKSPLRTPTGKLEIFSVSLFEGLPDDKERRPCATYVTGGPESEGWSHNNYPYGEKAETYPLMMVCSTSLWKHHSMLSDIPWNREIEKVIGWDGYAYAPVWLHPEVAEPRGIKNGDIVRVFNEQGGVLGGAVITEKVRPNIVRFEKAGGGHAIIPGELHQGGNVNCISPKNTFTKVCYGLAGINYLCDVEKVTGTMMDEWRENYPEAFERNKKAYDPARGPYFDGWVEGVK